MYQAHKICIKLVLSLAAVLVIPLCSAAQSRYMGEALFEGAMDQYVQGNYEAASQGYRRFLDIAPNDFNGHYLLGHCLRRLGDMDGALASYEHALAIKPDDVDALIYAGKLL